MNERGCSGTDRLEKSRRRKIAYFSLKTKIVLRQHKQMNHLIKLKYKKKRKKWFVFAENFMNSLHSRFKSHTNIRWEKKLSKKDPVKSQTETKLLIELENPNSKICSQGQAFSSFFK
jgi:hypothetical protein